MANYDLFNFLLPFGITETLTGDFPPPVQGLPSYFNVAITNGGFLEGSYDGWCLRSDRPVELTTYSASVYSSYGIIPAGVLPASLPNGGVQPLAVPPNQDIYLDALQEINWVLNNIVTSPLVGGRYDYNGNRYTLGDVQRAIWILIGTEPVSSGLTGPFTTANVLRIVAEAQANGSDFLAKAGDFIGVILSPGDEIQEALIQVRSAGIGDTVFFDSNNNGVADSGEGLDGVTVNLLADINGDSIFELIGTTVTGDNPYTPDVVETGAYSFGPLLAGPDGGPGITYQVVIDTSTLPEGYVNTVDPDGGNDSMSTETLTAGEVNLQQNFGYQAIDYGDAPESYGTTLASNGARHLLSVGQSAAAPLLKLGFVVDTEPDGQPSDGADGDDFNRDFGGPVPPNADDEDGIFINPITAGETIMLFAYVMEDSANVDGRLNAWIDYNADGDFNDPGEQIISDAAVNNGGNMFMVDAPGDAVAGDTYARFRLSSDPAAQNPTGLASDGEVEDYLVTITGLPTASLGDFVFDDLNADGEQDAGEPGVSDVTVNLYKDTNGDGFGDLFVETTQTNAQGFYLFDDLAPNMDYQVEFILPADFVSFTLPNAIPPANDATDSDADPNPGPNFGRAPVVSLAPDEFNPTIDAGLLKPAAIGDFVFKDLNGNGIQDPGEPGVEDVTVTLSGTDVFGNPVDRMTTTGANGEYLFNGDTLLPGTYKVTFSDLAPNHAFTVPDQGGNDATDSDADPTNGMTPFVTVGSGETNLTLDAGLVGAGIEIIKFVNGDDANNPTGPILTVGDDVTFTYEVRNTGNVSLASVVVFDDNGTPLVPGDDFNPSFTGGDLNGNTWLDLGEVWTYEAVSTVLEGQYTNIATTTGTPIYPPGTNNPNFPPGTPVPNLPPPTDDDPGNYFGEPPATPEIDLQKFVRVDANPLEIRKLVAVEPLNPGLEGQDLCDIIGDVEGLVFRYLPSNTFNTFQPPGKSDIILNNGIDNDDMAYIVVSDKDEDPFSGEIFFAGDVTIGEDFFASGNFSSNTYIYIYDSQGGPLLQEVQYHTSCSAPIILGAQALSATLVGVDGKDTGLITIPDPVFVDANEPTGPEAVVGSTVEYLIEVSNSGTTAITDVEVTDNNKTADPGDDFNPDPIEDGGFNVGDENQNNQLDPGEVWLYEFSETAESGQQTNIATATGLNGGIQFQAMDPANYLGVGGGGGGPNPDPECPTGPIGGIDLGDLTKYLFFFANGSEDANWQGATKGFSGDVVVDGLQADERTSGGVPYAGTIITNANSLGAWQDIVDQNPGQAGALTGQTTVVADLEQDLMDAFSQINSLSATSGYASVSSTSLDGLNTANGIAETFVINITSGLNFSSVIDITGDASDVFVLRWDTDANPNNGYQGTVKPQSGGAINPLGGLTAANFISVAGNINASGGGSNPSGLPQGPIDPSTGQLIDGGSNFSGGGFFTGYWLTTGNPTSGDTSSLSNAIFTGGWYTTSDKFSLTSGTSGVHVCPNPETQPPAPEPHDPQPPTGGDGGSDIILQTDDPFDPNNIGEDADSPTGPIAELNDKLTFTYIVENTGNVAVDITSTLPGFGFGPVDDNTTPDDPTDDFVPVAVEKANGNNFGDTNNNMLVDPGESWYFQAMAFATEPGQKTNDAKVIVVDANNQMAMDTDPANYLVNPLNLKKLVSVEPINPGMEGQDLCETAGDPEALVFRYIPSNTFNTFQDSGKSEIIVNNGIDNDNTAYIIVSDDDNDPLSGDIFFSGNVTVGSDFIATGNFSSNTYIYIYDSQGGPLLQEVQYHTSCSAPIILGAQALSATLVGYDGQNGGLITIPDPVFVDANNPPGPDAIIGTKVDFLYEVTNIGDTPLANIVVTDDKLTPTAVEENGFNIGDTNKNNLLDIDEKWLFDAHETAGEGLQTNKGTATAVLNGTTLMDMDLANYTGITNPPPAGDICDVFGKPTALFFDYEPSTDVITGQDSGKAQILFTNPNNGGVDDDGTSFIVVTDEEDASKALAGDGDQYFRGMVDVGEIFKADNSTANFGSSTVIHFFDDQNGGLLQSIEYHTSCSQPIQIGDVIGSATLVGYIGEEGGYTPAGF